MVTASLLMATGTALAARIAPDGDRALPYGTAVKLGQPGQPSQKAYEIAKWLRNSESPNRIVNQVAISQGQPSQQAYEIAKWLQAGESPNHSH